MQIPRLPNGGMDYEYIINARNPSPLKWLDHRVGSNDCLNAYTFGINYGTRLCGFASHANLATVSTKQSLRSQERIAANIHRHGLQTVHGLKACLHSIRWRSSYPRRQVAPPRLSVSRSVNVGGQVLLIERDFQLRLHKRSAAEWSR